MGNIKVILGENGKGKTRYLLNYYQNNRHDRCIAMISNSLLNPFPFHRNNLKHHYFDLRARDSLTTGLFSKSIRNYFSQLLNTHPTKDLFYILNHIGFNEELLITRKPLYKVQRHLDNVTNEAIYYLVFASDDKRDYMPRLHNNRQEKITPGFAEKLIPILQYTQEFHLRYDNHEIQHQAYLDSLEIEREFRRDIYSLRFNQLFKTEFYLKKDNFTFPLEHASSGELSILALGLFVKNFLEADKFSHLPKTILIDEPENSLHPKWQREYIGFLQGFIGYKENIDVIIATHSPLIAMDNLNYAQRIELMEIDNGYIHPIKHDEKNNNIEQIYYELFNLLTPKNRFLSDYCTNLLKDFAEHKITYDSACRVLHGMIMASFDSQQKKFLEDVINLLNKLNGRVHG
ncbi:AAA family ATPase [Enterobacter chuandaensis]|uniref:AAA family ATPase n=1 Tax=Enterobacter chuandaensis TaxID=2497875 RepID=UPI0039C07BBF